VSSGSLADSVTATGLLYQSFQPSGETGLSAIVVVGGTKITRFELSWPDCAPLTVKTAVFIALSGAVGELVASIDAFTPTVKPAPSELIVQVITVLALLSEQAQPPVGEGVPNVRSLPLSESTICTGPLLAEPPLFVTERSSGVLLPAATYVVEVGLGVATVSETFGGVTTVTDPVAELGESPIVPDDSDPVTDSGVPPPVAGVLGSTSTWTAS
jgi:hypothetical protein